MKKLKWLITFIMLLMMFTLSNAIASVSENRDGRSIVYLTKNNLESQTIKQTASVLLPDSLQQIGEEAFEGTAIVKIDLPESLTTIEDRAFANIKNLRNVYIPRSTTEIGKDVFVGTKQVTITAAPGSYARNWAQNNGIPFLTQVVFCASNGTVQISGYNINGGSQDKTTTAETIDIPKSSEAKGRKEGDIIAAKHEECFAFSLQGRSPPMKG